MSLPFLALIGAVLLSTSGQILLKKGAMLIDPDRLIMTLVTNTPLIGGLGCYLFSTALYVTALRKLDLSIAYPSTALSYVILIGASSLLYGEAITWQKIIGLAMVLGGLAMIWSQQPA